MKKKLLAVRQKTGLGRTKRKKKKKKLLADRKKKGQGRKKKKKKKKKGYCIVFSVTHNHKKKVYQACA